MKKIIIVASTLVAFAGLNLMASNISASALQKKIESQASAYKADGFTVTKKSKAMVLTIKDEVKVKAFLFDKFLSAMPTSYYSTIKPLREIFLSGDNTVYRGMQLRMKVIKVKGVAKLEVALIKLPDSAQKATSGKNAGNKWLRDVLAGGRFAYILSYDAKGTITGIALKDISEKIRDDDMNINFKVKSLWTSFVGDINKKIIIKEGLKNFSFSGDGRNNSFNFLLQNLKAVMNQKTALDYVSRSSIERITFNLDKYNKYIDFKMSGIAINGDAKSSSKYVDSKGEFLVNKISLRASQAKKLKLDVSAAGFKFALSVKHMDKDALLAMQVMKPNLDPIKSEQEFMKIIGKMINSGLTINLDALNLKDLSIKGPMDIRVRDFQFSLKAELQENTYDMNMASPMMLIPYTKVTGRLALRSVDLDKLMRVQPMLGMLVQMKKTEGNLAVFDLAFVNGQLTINGQMLPF